MSSNTFILVSGATGFTGSAAAKVLLQKGFRVRAMVHKNDERSRQLEAQGAEIVIGDFLDLRSVRRAFEGINRAYFYYPVVPGLVEATANFAQAAREAKAEFIVNISQRTSRPDALSNSALQHWLAERVFDWAGTPVVHLRPTAFNEWLLYIKDAICDGRYWIPFGPNGRFAPISSSDQGDVIAALLADPSGHAGQTYPLLGPVELTQPEIAEIVSKTLGREIRYEQATDIPLWLRENLGRDPEFGIQHIEAIVKMHELGQMGGTSDCVEKILGRPPQSVAEFVKTHQAAWEVDAKK